LATASLRLPAITRPLIRPVPALVVLFVATRIAAVVGMMLAKHGDLGQALSALAGSYDASWYEKVVVGGYGQTTLDNPVAGFYPGYPLLAGAFFQPLLWLFSVLDPTGHLRSSAGLGILVLSMLAASNLALVVGLVALWRLFRPMLGDAAAVIGIGLLLASPGAFFLSAGFSESTFVATTALAFLAASRGRWELAGLAGAAACLTRWTGALLILPLVLAWWESGERRLSARALTGLLLFGAGAGAYPLYLWAKFRDPLYYVHLQARDWHHQLSNPLRLIGRILLRGYRGLKAAVGLPSIERKGDAEVLIVDAAIVSWTLVTLVVGRLRLPVSQLAWVALMLVTPLMSGVSDSMNRYLLGAWPIFFLGGWFLRRRPVLATLLIVFSGAWMLSLAWHIAEGWFVA
jgi:hypothetical protein